MFAYAKNLVTNLATIVNSSDLYEVDREKRMCEPFEPKSATDFVEKKVYAKVEGDELIFYYILHMTDNEDDIMKVKSNPREHGVRNPKRWSDGPCKLPLSAFKMTEERKLCAGEKSSKSKQDKKEVNKEMDDEISSRFKQKLAIKEKGNQCQGSGQAAKRETENEANTPLIAPAQVKPKARGQTQNLPENSNCEGGVKRGLPSPQKNLPNPKKSHSEMGEGKTSEDLKNKITYLESENSDLRDKLEFALSSIKELNLEKETLRDTVNALQHQVEEAVKSISTLEIEKKTLTEMFTTEVSDLKSVKEDLKSMQASWTKSTCSLSSKRSAAGSLETDATVDCGDGKQLKKMDIAKIERRTDRFTSRVLDLATALYPEGLHLKYLSGEKVEGAGSTITDQEVAAMTEILNTMRWKKQDLLHAYQVAFRKKGYVMEDVEQFMATNVPVSSTLVRRQLAKVTYNARDTKTSSRKGKKKECSKKGKDGAPEAASAKKNVNQQETSKSEEQEKEDADGQGLIREPNEVSEKEPHIEVTDAVTEGKKTEVVDTSETDEQRDNEQNNAVTDGTQPVEVPSHIDGEEGEGLTVYDIRQSGSESDSSLKDG